MIKYAGVVLFALTMGVSMANEHDATIFPYQYEVRQLENGLKYILIPMESPGLVSYFSVVRTGSRDEYEPGHSGFAHLFEHMMFRGTKNFPGDVYDEMVTRLGADGNAYTTDDYTCYFMTFSSGDLEQVMLLESDRFQNLEYSESEFQTETGAVYGEYRKGRTNPWSVLFEEIHDLAYDVHTYQHTTIGFEKDIKAMPEMYEYSLSFFDRYYRPENVVVMVVGDIDTEETASLVKKYYAGWVPGYTAPKIAPEPPQKAERSAEVSYNGRTLPILDVAHKGMAFEKSMDDYAAVLLLGELAFGENSDLYKQLVIEQQTVQFIATGFDRNRDPGLLHVLSMIKSEEDIGYVQALIEETFATYQKSLVEPTTLESLKSRLKYGFLMDLDTPSSVAHNLASYIALTGGIDSVDVFYASLSRITPEDIKRVANTYFTEQNRNVIVLKGAQG